MPRKCLIKFWIVAAMLGAFTVGHHGHGQRSKSSTAATRLAVAAVAPATSSARGGINPQRGDEPEDLAVADVIGGLAVPRLR